MLPKALADVKVIEFAEFVAAPYCGKLLADLGAETIKLEAPPSGDAGRGHRLFLYLNTNKMGITLNPSAPQGRQLFTKLISAADVLISDKTKREMDKLGLGYAGLRKLNPHLIITCLTPFGLSGPYRDFKAYHLNVYHASGMGYLTPLSQKPGREPTIMGGLAGECACGISAALATMAALLWQRITGRGQLIDLSQQEALLSMIRPHASRFPNEGVIPTRLQKSAGDGGLMACRDGHIVAMFTDGPQWRALVRLMGDPAWAKPEYEELSCRAEHYAEIRPWIEAWMREHTKEEIFHKAQSLGCPVSPVLSPEDLETFPQFQARGIFVTQEHPQAGRVTFPGAPFRLPATPWRVERPAPLLGEHSEEVYCKRLGCSPQEMEELRREGVI